MEHHGVVNLKYRFERNLEITPADNIIQFANYVFDASVSEMTMALLNGATLVCMPAVVGQNPKEFSEYCKQNRVTVATLPPNYYLQKEVDVEFRKLLTAGSESSMALIKKVGDSSYINDYGPTENTVCASYWEKEENWDATFIPIGKPISNTQIYILNGDNLCGIGVPGELCITGDGLARGYLNRPELTAKKFVKNPFGEGRLYRSGDLARWLPDGNIEYLGRIDEQVKIRGFRIELGEVESRIREIEGIQNSVVIAKADQNGDQALHAYYTGESISVSELREHLAGVLPEYMIPSYIMEIDSIPVTRNGKLDKKALPEIEVKAIREYVAPNNETEETICKIFSEILAVESVGVKDSFFELGGHSLRATRLVNKIESETGYR
ncbi:non-ribosomal peptide synthetase, partial [Lysinibacillus sphaericus]|uniref:non-ribosomal peptide synthetase n=1 Tax=Lysinibacillus sphaericus TaxID=1421 RepID=UPI001F54D188